MSYFLEILRDEGAEKFDQTVGLFMQCARACGMLKLGDGATGLPIGEMGGLQSTISKIQAEIAPLFLGPKGYRDGLIGTLERTTSGTGNAVQLDTDELLQRVDQLQAELLVSQDHGEAQDSEIRLLESKLKESETAIEEMAVIEELEQAVVVVEQLECALAEDKCQIESQQNEIIGLNSKVVHLEEELVSSENRNLQVRQKLEFAVSSLRREGTRRAEW